jgi:Flp pilus assembly pilin Flp
VVSVEWIILGAVIMAAIVLAFAPTFQGQLSAAVTAIGAQLQSQVSAAGS